MSKFTTVLSAFALVASATAVAQETVPGKNVLGSQSGWESEIDSETSVITMKGDWKGFGYADWNGVKDWKKYKSVTFSASNITNAAQFKVYAQFVNPDSLAAGVEKKPTKEIDKTVNVVDGNASVTLDLTQYTGDWPLWQVNIQTDKAGTFVIDEFYFTLASEDVTFGETQVVPFDPDSKSFEASVFASLADDSKLEFVFAVTVDKGSASAFKGYGVGSINKKNVWNDSNGGLPIALPAEDNIVDGKFTFATTMGEIKHLLEGGEGISANYYGHGSDADDNKITVTGVELRITPAITGEVVEEVETDLVTATEGKGTIELMKSEFFEEDGTTPKYADDAKFRFYFDVVAEGDAALVDNFKYWGGLGKVESIGAGEDGNTVLVKQPDGSVNKEGTHFIEFTFADIKPALEVTKEYEGQNISGICCVVWGYSQYKKNDGGLFLDAEGAVINATATTVEALSEEEKAKLVSGALKPTPVKIVSVSVKEPNETEEETDAAPAIMFDTDAEVLSTSYVTLSGVASATPARGINIVVQQMSDGSVRTFKAILK